MRPIGLILWPTVDWADMLRVIMDIANGYFAEDLLGMVLCLTDGNTVFGKILNSALGGRHEIPKNFSANNDDRDRVLYSPSRWML